MTAAALKISLVTLAFIATVVSERQWPADVRSFGESRIWRNLGLAFINFLLGPLLVLPISAYASAHGLGLRPAWWNLALDLLLLDLWIYGWHRINHAMPFLWRFHEVHHRDEMLDATSAVRFHFGEVILSALVRGVVIFIFSIPLTSVVTFEIVVVLATLFHHSNLRLPVGFETQLSRLIITPRLHWVHHHAFRRDTDSNYATILSCWDLVFKSRSPNVRVVGMKLGVEGEVDLPLVQLLTRPFNHLGN
jgi:sterol desaturase/sphingolipid hydroxylase (fatty acid hydroxylase superfamily)